MTVPLPSSAGAAAERPSIQPALTLSEIHGPGHVFSPRAHPGATTWLPQDDAVLDSLTGGQLAILGSMPILCSAAVASERGLDLLLEAGLVLPRRVIAYRDLGGYRRRLRRLARGGLRIVNTHWHPAGVLPEACYANPQPLLSELNNKAFLGRVVPARWRPRRRQRAPRRLASAAIALPAIFKATTRESTGGGGDVMICRRRADLATAGSYFASCRTVVLEEWLPMRRSYCLNYAAMHDGSVRYLGAAEQICSREGRYLGNWLDSTRPVPGEALAAGLATARRITRTGYRGLFGMDAAILPDESVKVFDLNIRVNGCTAPILLDASARGRHGHRVALLRSWNGADGSAGLFPAARRAIAAGLILPLGVFDPAAIGRTKLRPGLRGLVLGDSRKDVRRREAELARLGLV